MKLEVVVTGIGVTTPLESGRGTSFFWEQALLGTNKVGLLTHFDTTGHRSRVGAQIEGRESLGGPFFGQHTDPCVKILSHALMMAINDASLSAPDLGALGLSVGTILGGICTGQDYLGRKFFSNSPPDPDGIRPYCLDALAGEAALKHGLGGPVISLSTACCSGADAIRTAAAQIRAGRVPMMAAGGVDVLSEFVFRGFSALNSLTTDGYVRPFDLNRRGLALGEGAAVLILEEKSHAAARGAKMYCAFAGGGTSADASHLVKPHRDGEGLARAVSRALVDANDQGSAIDMICAHGTGTPYNDAMETKAIKTALRERAGGLKITAFKSMIGHSLGAASAIEAVVCVKAIETGVIPPTINHTTKDPQCDLDYVLNNACRRKIDRCMSLSAGFGGQNTALVFERVQ